MDGDHEEFEKKIIILAHDQTGADVDLAPIFFNASYVKIKTPQLSVQKQNFSLLVSSLRLSI